jgi:hypothetical protein
MEVYDGIWMYREVYGGKKVHGGIFVNKQPDSDPINSPPAFFTDADAWRVGRVVHVERLFVVF